MVDSSLGSFSEPRRFSVSMQFDEKKESKLEILATHTNPTLLLKESTSDFFKCCLFVGIFGILLGFWNENWRFGGACGGGGRGLMGITTWF